MSVWFQNRRAKFRKHERLTHHHHHHHQHDNPFERDPTSVSISEGLLMQPSPPMVIGGVAKDSNELYGHQYHHHQQNGSESSYIFHPEPLLPATSNTTTVSTFSNEVNGDPGQTSSSMQQQQQQSYVNSGSVTPSTFLTHLSSPTSDWPHYVTTPTSAASPPSSSSVYHPTPSYREDPTGGNGSDDYHFFSHSGLDLASSFINHSGGKDSPSLRLNGQSQQSEQTDDDADIGDEIHLANMAFINTKTGHHHHQHHHQEQQSAKNTGAQNFQTSDYDAPDEEENDACNTMTMNDA